ncbi:MAG: hypothetical protein D6753_05460, partial [Planctomycetota bacterium]
MGTDPHKQHDHPADPQHAEETQQDGPGTGDEPTFEMQNPSTAEDSHQWLQSVLAEHVGRQLPFESEPECREFVERMRDLESVRKLAKETGDEEPDPAWRLPKELGQFVLF